LRRRGFTHGAAGDQQRAGLEILGNEQLGAGDHALGGLAGNEFALDRAGPDAADTIDRKHDGLAGLARELSEGIGGVAAGYVERSLRCLGGSEREAGNQDTDPRQGETQPSRGGVAEVHRSFIVGLAAEKKGLGRSAGINERARDFR
jgi:hypothetical protein